MTTSPRNKFPIVEILISFLIGIGLLLLVLLLLHLTRPARTPVGVVTAVMTVIYAPTDTPILPTATPTTPTPGPDDPPLPPDNLTVGTYVQIVGTGGDGLRLREGPGLDYEPLHLGLDAEIFQVDDGPRDIDGYTWWHLVAPYDETRSGWAASNFLEVVNNP